LQLSRQELPFRADKLRRRLIQREPVKEIPPLVGFMASTNPVWNHHYSARKRLSLPVVRRGMLSTTVTVTVGSGSPERASAS